MNARVDRDTLVFADPRLMAKLAGFPESGASRFIDVVLAVIAIIVLGPVLVGVAICIWVGDPGPVLFAHQRIGRGGKMFPCYKFRSMVVDSEERLRALLECDPEARLEWNRDHKLKSDPRITRIGYFLRKSSLDELPQFLNVILGQMSLVGPRPIVTAEVQRYGRYFAYYCSVRPGITGLWQVSGRSSTTYRRRVAMDVAYARSKSLLLDLRIMAATPLAVLLAKGSC